MWPTVGPCLGRRETKQSVKGLFVATVLKLRVAGGGVWGGVLSVQRRWAPAGRTTVVVTGAAAALVDYFCDGLG